MSTAYELLAEELTLHLGLDPAIIRPESTFAELGMDSLDITELAVALRDQHGIDAEGIDATGTLAQVAASLANAGLSELPVADGPQRVDGTQ